MGFYSVESLTWTLPPAARPRVLWLRYAARRDVVLRFAIDDRLGRARLAATGSLAGDGAFSWGRLDVVPPSERAARLTLWGAGLRPDCFELLSPGETPRDSAPTDPLPEKLSAETLAALRAAPARRSAAWLASSSRATLPDWIEETRIGLHTRLSVAWAGLPLFARAEAAAASLGAPALVRHVNSMRGECFWPSDVGAVAAWVSEATRVGGDPVEQMVRRAHSQGIALVAYYRHQEDRPLAERHPDWVCRDLHGRTIRTAGQPRLCYHSPFAEATWTRLSELAERGVDGIYLDEDHQPLDGCWCEWTRRAFERATGLPLPATDRPDDPLVRRFLAFCEDSLAERLASRRGRLAERSPRCVLIVGTHRQPDLLGSAPDAAPGLRRGRGQDRVRARRPEAPL